MLQHSGTKPSGQSICISNDEQNFDSYIGSGTEKVTDIGRTEYQTTTWCIIILQKQHIINNSIPSYEEATDGFSSFFFNYKKGPQRILVQTIRDKFVRFF